MNFSIPKATIKSINPSLPGWQVAEPNAISNWVIIVRDKAGTHKIKFLGVNYHELIALIHAQFPNQVSSVRIKKRVVLPVTEQSAEGTNETQS